MCGWYTIYYASHLGLIRVDTLLRRNMTCPALGHSSKAFKLRQLLREQTAIPLLYVQDQLGSYQGSYQLLILHKYKVWFCQARWRLSVICFTPSPGDRKLYVPSASLRPSVRPSLVRRKLGTLGWCGSHKFQKCVRNVSDKCQKTVSYKNLSENYLKCVRYLS